jgi:hypothetical protein
MEEGSELWIRQRMEYPSSKAATTRASTSLVVRNATAIF